MMGLNDDNDENLDAAESSDDERSGYPTLPVDGIGLRPSVSSLRHVSPLRILFDIDFQKSKSKLCNIPSGCYENDIVTNKCT